MRLTSNQQRVLATLEQSARPLSAYSILNSLRSQGFKAPMQVYRALDHLSESGLVHRLESINAYVTCASPPLNGKAFRAFAICDHCGHVDEFTAPSLDTYLEGWIEENVFSLGSSTIELHGTCASCSKADLDTAN